MTSLTCVVRVDEAPCTGVVTLADPVPLCDEHKIQIAMAVTPGVLTSAFRDARTVGARTLPPDVAHMVASAKSVPMPVTDPHGLLVYFLANGGRVKIGHSKSLFSRISALSLRDDAVLLLLEGGMDLERALHAKFGPYRVGDSEWFELASEIVHFVAAKGPKHRAGRVRRPARPKKRKTSVRSTEGSRVSSGMEEIRRDIDRLVALMTERGGADAVSLNDAKVATGRSTATAARRLKAAREQYRKSA